MLTPFSLSRMNIKTNEKSNNYSHSEGSQLQAIETNSVRFKQERTYDKSFVWLTESPGGLETQGQAIKNTVQIFDMMKTPQPWPVSLSGRCHRSTANITNAAAGWLHEWTHGPGNQIQSLQPPLLLPRMDAGQPLLYNATSSSKTGVNL